MKNLYMGAAYSIYRIANSDFQGPHHRSSTRILLYVSPEKDIYSYYYHKNDASEKQPPSHTSSSRQTTRHNTLR